MQNSACLHGVLLKTVFKLSHALGVINPANRSLLFKAVSMALIELWLAVRGRFLAAGRLTADQRDCLVAGLIIVVGIKPHLFDVLEKTHPVE